MKLTQLIPVMAAATINQWSNLVNNNYIYPLLNQAESQSVLHRTIDLQYISTG